MSCARRAPAVRRRRATFYGALLAGAWFAAGCADDPPDRAAVAASNELLAAAARAVLGPEIGVFSLAEPGTCPGHFDVRPSQVRRLRRAPLVLRFDFQQSLDRQVGQSGVGPRIAVIEAPDGLCVPETYTRICRQVAEAGVAAGLVERGVVAARLAGLEAAMAALGAEVREAVVRAGLAGRPVVASDHQAAFCRFLGLDVVATLTTAERATRSDIRDVLTRGASAGLVIANRPEGTDLADALATSIAARVVVFGNFPEPEAHGGQFDALVRDNVCRLIEGVRP